MKKNFLYSVVALCALMVSCCKASQGTEEKQEQTKSSPEISAIQTANGLAVYGYETESPTALLEAANIILSYPTRNLDADSLILSESTDEIPKEKKVSFEPIDLIAAAKEYANGDEVLGVMIARVEAKLAEVEKDGPVRGRTTGSGYLSTRVYANTTDTYSLRFRGNEFAEIAVVGDGDTDLDLYVYDEYGNLITSDLGYSDRCYVSFVPSWTGSFTVKVKNRGNVYNNYSIVTN